MKPISELFDSVASILWPIFAFVALYMFRTELRSLLSRIQKGKFLGQEIELQESLIKLNEKAVGAANIPKRADLPALQTQSSVDTDTAQRILVVAAESPKAALMLLSSELESELRKLFASSGWHTDQSRLSAQEMLSSLVARGVMPAPVAGSAKMFQEVRNHLVHGYSSSADAVLSAIDSGLTILRAIQAIPHESHFVVEPEITIYEDANGTRPRTPIKGIVLESRSPGGTKTHRRVFPITVVKLQKGDQVSWEWNLAVVVGESWYRDQETKELKLAWERSAEFRGQKLTEM